MFYLGGIINPFLPNVSSSGVFLDIGAELWGYVFKQRSIKDIRLLGEKGQGVLIFLFPIYLYLRNNQVTWFMYPLFLKCVSDLTLICLSLSLWGGFIHVLHLFFYRLKGNKRER